MISLGVDEKLMKELLDEVNGLPDELRRQTVIAINKTVPKVVSLLAKSVTEEVNVPQKAVKALIKTEKASVKGNRIEATVILRKSDRLSLKEFKARQTKKGVSYKIKKGGGGRGFLPGGFIVQQYGGHVYKRPGKNRPTGKRKRGPSPWGVVVKNEKDKPIRIATRVELRKQLSERIRFTGLRRSGVI